MKKKLFIYLTLLVTIMVSCDSSSDELPTKDEVKAVSETENTSIENDSIIILSRTKIFPKAIKNSKTSRMESYVYLSSTNTPYSDRAVADCFTGRKLVLRIQGDGNLCLNIVQSGTEYYPQPNEVQFVWGTFNYAHSTGSYQLVNDSNGNVATYKDYGYPYSQCIWASGTEVSPDFEHQYLEIIMYTKSTGIFGTNKRTFARVQLLRKYPGGSYQWAGNLCDKEISRIN